MNHSNETIFMVGLGLIGGSIALAIKNEFPEICIAGYDISEEQSVAAKKLGVIDRISSSIEEGINEASIIFLSTPVEQTVKLLDCIAKSERKEPLLVTDVGSTKKRVADYAEQVLPENFEFIGGHPMAGSHKSGVTAAKKLLFENAFYILTPSKSAKLSSLAKLKELLRGTHANFLEMSPEDHDEVTSVISHFPHIVAASLVHQASRFENGFPIVKRLAAGGFRDITRIASSSPAMWRDILLHNKDKMISRFDEWQKEMDNIRSYVENEDAENLYAYFQMAKNYRDGLPIKQKGAIPAFYDLYVDVPDSPGVISEITAILAAERISITNIRIIETREEINGVLRISFQSDADRKQAEKCIRIRAEYDTFYAD
ncbi:MULTISPECIES: prephenate dehydrogenase [Bacillus]|uniref:Prephenate dehydrogenase n=2 Tax=Bacillus TaxID=1386 RepID=A0A0M5JBF0_9BACI|nr:MULTISPECIES: prephenate dehydrogenase [Bacillus]ALC81407.1 prephenate dehydrogenase [Bacillus gobiensis]MBP1080439.1 prephenate dehydrogenase [Bacillus capparidis]MED1094296.1 prephenate dehydrogenase [Bacillus capparidis]